MLQESFQFPNFAATTAEFSLVGGRYAFAALGTWNSGSLALQALGPNGSTYIDLLRAYDTSSAEENEPINKLTANGVLILDLAPGGYKLTVAGSPSALYASVSRIPLD